MSTYVGGQIHSKIVMTNYSKQIVATDVDRSLTRCAAKRAVKEDSNHQFVYQWQKRMTPPM